MSRKKIAEVQQKIKEVTQAKIKSATRGDAQALEQLQEQAEDLDRQADIFRMRVKPQEPSFGEKFAKGVKIAAAYLSLAFDFCVAAVGHVCALAGRGFSNIGKSFKKTADSARRDDLAELQELRNPLSQRSSRTKAATHGKDLTSKTDDLVNGGESFVQMATRLKKREANKGLFE